MATLTRKEVAQLSINTFGDVDTAEIMTAIAEAESRFKTNQEGDSPNDLIFFRDELGFDISDENIIRARLWNCPDPGESEDEAGVSIGLWQIFLPAWHITIQSESGINIDTVYNADADSLVPSQDRGSCTLIDWLKIPQNNANIANIIQNTQTGFRHWTTFNLPQSNTNSYLNFLPQARQAVADVLEDMENGVDQPDTPPVVEQGISTFPLILLTSGILTAGLLINEAIGR